MSSSTPSAAFLSESRVPTVYAASIAAIVISSVFFIGRIASKRLQRLGPRASDYTLVLSLMCCWGMATVNLWMTTIGLGRHLAWMEEVDPSLSNLKHLLKVTLADDVFYDLGIASVKTSILLFYKEIFGCDRIFSSVANLLIAVVAAWFLGNLLPSIFSCNPVSGLWDLDPNAKCISFKALYISGSAVNIATDIAILCLPLTKIFHLRLAWQRKLELLIAFLLGGIVVAVSVYRFTVLFSADSPDTPWEDAAVFSWSAVEIGVAIASACLPLMRPLLSAVLACSWAKSAAKMPAHVEGLAARIGIRESSKPRSSITIESVESRLHHNSQRQSAMSAKISANHSNIEPLGFTADVLSSEGRRSVVQETQRRVSELHDFETGRGNTDNSIVVMRSIQISSVDRPAETTRTEDRIHRGTSRIPVTAQPLRDSEQQDEGQGEGNFCTIWS